MQSLELVRHDKVPAVRAACQAALAAVATMGPQPAAAAAESPHVATLTHRDGASASARPGTAVREVQPSGTRYAQEPGILLVSGKGDASSGTGPRGMQGASGVAMRGREAQGVDQFGTAVEQEAGKEVDRSWEVGAGRRPSDGGGRVPGGQQHGPVREAWSDAGARPPGQVEVARVGQQQQREQAWARSSLPRQQHDPEGAAGDEAGAEDMGDAEPEVHTLTRTEEQQQWHGQGDGAFGEELIDQDLRLSREHVDFLQQQAEQLMGVCAQIGRQCWVHAEDREDGVREELAVSAHSAQSQRQKQQHHNDGRGVGPGLHHDWAGSGQAASGSREPAPAPMVVRPLQQPRSAGRPGRYGGADVSRDEKAGPRRSVEQGSYAAAYAKGLQDGQDMARTPYYDDGKRVEKATIRMYLGWSAWQPTTTKGLAAPDVECLLHCGASRFGHAIYFSSLGPLTT